MTIFPVLIVNCPINSTQVENISGAESHHNLELSRIPGPADHDIRPVQPDLEQDVSAEDTAVSDTGGLHVCH